jgi:hypothetical protein
VYLLVLETLVGSFLSSCLACLTATVRLKNNNSSQPVKCVIQKRTPHNKRKQKLNCAKEKNAAKFKFVLKKGYRIGYKNVYIPKIRIYILQHIPLKKRIGEYPISRFLDRIWDIYIL